MSPIERIALIGFGEAGSILGQDLARGGRRVCTYDVLLDEPGMAAAMRAKAERCGVQVCASVGAAVEGVQLVISAVTAAASHMAATAAAESLGRGQLFLDINSVAPATKVLNAGSIEASGAEYLDVAVMAPVPAQRLAVPMLLGGIGAMRWLDALRELGFSVSVISDRVGVASAVKMCRSIVIKGLEALALESLMAARRLGAEEEVLRSLQHSFPHMGWEAELPDYLISRVAEHGRRRAAEMREVARTLESVGLAPLMALATAARQDDLIDAMGERGLRYELERPFSWRLLADRLTGKSSETD